ncbi:MAG: phage tail protein [Betaproteobacteria bacterium]|nr:phage tail protein [Betaproteobacteria bacterium]
MSKPAFTWTPDLGAQQSIEPAVTQTKFGDGYELRTAAGINFKPRSWAVTFSKNASEALPLLAFLEACGGVEAFAWTDPLNRAGTYVCRKWDATQTVFGVYSVSAAFDEVFEY